MPGPAQRRLLADFRHFSGGRLRLLWLLVVGGAFAEGLGIAMLIPLLVIVGGSNDVPDLLRPLVEFLGRFPIHLRLTAVLALFAALMALRALLIYHRDVLQARIAADYAADLQLRAAATLAGIGWARAAQLGLSGVQSLLLTEIPRCLQAIHYAQTAMLSALMLAVNLLLAAIISPLLALTTTAIVGAAFAASRGLFRRSGMRGVQISGHVEQSNAAAFRLHSGLKSALAQGSVPLFLRDYQAHLHSLASETIGFVRDSSRVRALGSVGAVVAAIAIVYAGRHWLDLSPPLLATVLVLFARMNGPAQALQQALHSFAVDAPAFGAIEDTLGKLSVRPGKTSAATPLEWARLRLAGATYQHGQSGFAVRDVSLTISKGEWLGLSGPSASGKTTLADLAVGLLRPSDGALLIDEMIADEQLLAQLRPTIAYVGQNEMTFEGSIRRNLLMGRDDDLEDDQLWSALALVGLEERVAQFPAGLDSGVGDRGSALSGGERQRLAIARAVLRHPRLIVLDEATNALDQESEERILAGLRNLDPRPAAILVAHREGPLRLCDTILRLGDSAD